MHVAKILASIMIVFLLMRAVACSKPTNANYEEYQKQGEEKLLSRSKRFSMNEYMMIILSVFNVFVFMYNNVETFFPNQVTKQSKPQQFSEPISLKQQTLENIQPKAEKDINNMEDLATDRNTMIDQISEMLIR